MEILYIANARIPTNKANGKQIMKTCEALAKTGHRVELLLPNRKQEPKFRDIDPFKFYGIPKSFSVSHFCNFDFIGLTGSLPAKIALLIYFLQEVSFVFTVIIQRARTFKGKIIYTRCLTAAVILKAVTDGRVFYEAHDISAGALMRKLYFLLVSSLDGLVVISEGLEKKFAAGGISRIAVIPGSVDAEEIARINRSTARRKFNLGSNKMVVYTGRLTEPKGVYTLIAAAEKVLATEKNIVFYLVGDSTENDLRNLRRQANGENNIKLVGPVAQHEYFIYQRAADVLVLPGSALFDNPREYSSPLKLFEYLASGVPMVATNVPANTSILTHEITAYLVEPDNSKELARGIMTLLSDRKLARTISKNASRESRKYTWETRAEKIIKFVH